MPTTPIAAVMIHVLDVRAALSWYRLAFPAAVNAITDDGTFEYLVLDGLQLEFVLADEKVGAGPCGTVVYWSVHDLNAEVQRLEGIGARLFRGPMEIERSTLICQVQDPWGNCIGIRSSSALAIKSL